MATGGQRKDQHKVEYVNSLLWHPDTLTEVGLAFWYHAVYFNEKEGVIQALSNTIICKEMEKLRNFSGYLFSKVVLLSSGLKEGPD